MDGLLIDKSTIPSHTCEACIQAKQAHRAFPKEAENRAKIPEERIMCDVWGPAPVESIGHFKYYLSFVDDNTRYGQVIFLHNKAEATEKMEGQMEQIE